VKHPVPLSSLQAQLDDLVDLISAAKPAEESSCWPIGFSDGTRMLALYPQAAALFLVVMAV